jgi:hypothetical protein
VCVRVAFSAEILIKYAVKEADKVSTIKLSGEWEDRTLPWQTSGRGDGEGTPTYI